MHRGHNQGGKRRSRKFAEVRVAQWPLPERKGGKNPSPLIETFEGVVKEKFQGSTVLVIDGKTHTKTARSKRDRKEAEAV